MTLEETLAALCEAHNATCFSVSLNLRQSKKTRFDVTIHWEGYSNAGTACIIEHGPDISTALAKAISGMRVRRTAYHAARLPTFDAQVAA